MNTKSDPNRQIAKMAARNVYLYSAQLGLTASPRVNTNDIDSRLIAEAKVTDRYTCTDTEMLALLRAEYNKVKGQSLGGHVSAAMRKKVAVSSRN